MAVTYKTKQYLLRLSKLLVIVLTFGYIFFRIRNNPDLDLIKFVDNVYAKGYLGGYAVLGLLIVASLNWFFEILKWKNLVSTLQKTTFRTALKQSLAALTISLATPNRIGDYGAKALFFEKEKRKKVLVLNFFSHINQLLATLIFGLLGLSFFMGKYKIVYSARGTVVLGIAFLALAGLAYFFKEKKLTLKGLSIANIVRFCGNLSTSLKTSVFAYSILRYIIFSAMFYGVLLFFGAHIPLTKALVSIFTMYLLVSIAPSAFIFDVVIRGGVAVWVFSFEGVSEFAVLSTVFTLWIFNFVLPALLGSYYILTHQPTTQ